MEYRHISLIEFESLEDETYVRQKGLEHEKRGKVSSSALRLGKKYHTKILASYIPDVSVQWVHPAVGSGLFANEVIKKGQYVGEYTGVVRRNDRRYFEPMNHYCYEYPVPDEIGRSFVIDATAGCLTRFINHSVSPNLSSHYAYWDGFYHLIFLALTTIEPGKQLSFDYGETYWYIREKPIEFILKKS
jgi:uncharacterized protein